MKIDSPVEQKRTLGAYYTPEAVASVLVSWALPNGSGTILDPSFGGCAFLNTAVETLTAKGVPSPGQYVFGVDIDPGCVEYFRKNKMLHESNCIIKDFFEVDLGDIPGAPFDAIVGNPPFVRHHWFKGRTRSAARQRVNEAKVQLPNTASSWAYFIVHSLSFLAPNGRLVMLVPEAILQTDYSESVRGLLVSSFGSVTLIHICDRLFDGTNESVVVIAASGFGQRGHLKNKSAGNVEELQQILNCHSDVPEEVTYINGRRLKLSTKGIIDRLIEHDSVYRMKELASVRIGLVTGANEYFIRSKEDLDTMRIPSRARIPIVARTKSIRGITFSQKDHDGMSIAGERCFLIRPTSSLEPNANIQRWISSGVEKDIDDRIKCTCRNPWFTVDFPIKPDALASCCRAGSPMITLNIPRIPCTNTLHALRWYKDLPTSPEAIAVGYLTSLSSIWAELNGRRYGGGVLKLEPSILNQIPVPLAFVSRKDFGLIDSLLRNGKENEARRKADELILKSGLQISSEDIANLQSARSTLMSQRLHIRKRKDNG